jgi:hypothetical protein
MLLRSIVISCAYRAYELEVSMWNGTLDALLIVSVCLNASSVKIQVPHFKNEQIQVPTNDVVY